MESNWVELCKKLKTERKAVEMESIIELCKEFKTEYKAAKHFGIHQQQLQRWLKSDAHIDEKGDVYIKTKGVIKIN